MPMDISAYCELIDVSTWEEKPWMNSGGTRNKRILTSPQGEDYYFKESYNKGKKYYKYEFYSEVIASFIGSQLKLDVLQYRLAICGEDIGCLSKSMLLDQETLIEGGNLLQGFDSSFLSNGLDKPKEKYTWQLIKSALKHFNKEDYLGHLKDIIIFDSIIGNSDRHQENWAFIKKPIQPIVDLQPLGVIAKIRDFFNAKKPLKNISSHELIFAPIYDSGCCLGRELEEDKIEEHLKNKMQMDGFVNRGRAEFYWDGVSKKCKHTELILLLITEDSSLKNRVRELITKLDLNKIQSFLTAIDSNLPTGFIDYKLSENRKEFILKVITLRLEKLQKLIND